MIRACAAALALHPAAHPAEPMDWTLTGPQGSAQVRLLTQGEDLEADWASFLDALFNHVDFNDNSYLDPSEAERIFPLPLADRGQIAPDFAKMDANGDGKIARDEFKDYYRRGGFTPVVITPSRASAETLQLGESLFRHLDSDGNGQLSAAELAAAPRLIDKLDGNEDEVLTTAEIRIADLVVQPPRETIDITSAEGQAAAAMRLDPAAPSVNQVAGITLHVVPDPRGPADIESVARFHRAQFRDALSGESSLSRQQLADAGLPVIEALFNIADRDCNGHLTAAELEAVFRLITQGARCQRSGSVELRGRNLFDVLDTDGDERLDFRELTAAAKLPNRPLTRDQVPFHARLVTRRGPPGDQFGPLQLARRTAQPARPSPPDLTTPRWFRAMDRNSDGLVSIREYLGTPDVFRRLDRNGDGVISPAEAQAADNP